jgi:zinc protease
VTSAATRARRFTLTLVTGLALGALFTAPSHAAAKIQHLVSPGGIEAWFVQDSTVPLIAMEYAFSGGASQDPAAKPGVGNMVADLLDEGSGDLDSKAFHERLDRRAIELSFSATRDYFRGSLRMLKDNRDEAFDLLRLSLTSPHFDDADVERIRAQLMSGLRREVSSPNALAGRKFLQAAYGDGHPYGRPAGGTLQSVPTIDVNDLKDYARRVLAKNTLRIAVVGDVDAATLGQLLDRTFGELPAKAELTPVADVEAAKPPQRFFIPLDVPQTVVMFGGPGIKRADPNFMAAYVVNHILGSGGSSRLYREVREKRGLAYSISESLLWMNHSALFIGSTGTRGDRAAETVDAVNEEVRRMAEDGPTRQELDEAKSYLKGSQMLALDTSSKLASALLQYQLDKLGIDYIEKRNAVVEAVTIDQVRQAAKRLWGQGLVTVIVGRAPETAAQPLTPVPASAVPAAAGVPAVAVPSAK